jgi:hypothetical protein
MNDKVIVGLEQDIRELWSVRHEMWEEGDQRVWRSRMRWLIGELRSERAEAERFERIWGEGGEVDESFDKIRAIDSWLMVR